MEAAIVFARASLHRLQSRYRGTAGWREWWDSLSDKPSVDFVRRHRDVILKEAPFRVGQVIRLGEVRPMARDSYYVESPDIPATHTIARYIGELEELIDTARYRFGNPMDDV